MKEKRLRKILRILFITLFVLSIITLAIYYYKLYNEKQENQGILENIVVDETKITEEKTKRILQLEQLQKENQEIIGWLEIEGTNINYPVCQTTNNEYYLTHNYKKEKAITGALFLDSKFDFTGKSINYLIYGHSDTNGLMFDDLLKYKDEEFYKSHKKIKFTTLSEDVVCEVIAVFYSRVYYTSEKNVFRYYDFINVESEKEYVEYIDNCKKSSIYETGVTADLGDKLITLSTCDYTQVDGRFVVVAKIVT